MRRQPAKLAAFEGLFETRAQAPLHPFGWVDERNRRVVGPAVPGALSFLAYGDFNAEVTGLDAFGPDERPPVQAVFQFFHLMVAIGMTLIGLSLLGVLLWWRGVLFAGESRFARLYLWTLVLSVVLPQMANESGWFTAEIGRQPWIVYGLLRTSHGLSNGILNVGDETRIYHGRWRNVSYDGGPKIRVLCRICGSKMG